VSLSLYITCVLKDDGFDHSLIAADEDAMHALLHICVDVRTQN
jgi:hypothetical protein